MNAEQESRKAEILRLVDDTLHAIECKAIDMDDLDDLICMEPPCSVEHAAYTMAMAILGA